MDAAVVVVVDAAADVADNFLLLERHSLWKQVPHARVILMRHQYQRPQCFWHFVAKSLAVVNRGFPHSMLVECSTYVKRLDSEVEDGRSKVKKLVCHFFGIVSNRTWRG